MSRGRFLGIEVLPVEVIGDILSWLKCPRDVIRASITCRKWQEAFRRNLRTLSFNYSDDLHFYGKISSSHAQRFITQMILQTNGLRDLSIMMPRYVFSDSTVIAWLMHTREILCRLCYGIKTDPNINVLDICGRQKLEVLSISYNPIVVEPRFHRFPCLRSLSLSNLSISPTDLNWLLSTCPKLENLELVSLTYLNVGAQKTVKLSSLTLQRLFFEGRNLEKIILEINSICYLHLTGCSLGQLEVIGKGSLKHLKIYNSGIKHLDIGESVNTLEILDVTFLTVVWSNFYQMILKSSKLYKLRLCDLLLAQKGDEIVDFEKIAACLPLLSHLSLSYDLRYNALKVDGRYSTAKYDFRHTSNLEEVVVLEVCSFAIDGYFWGWVEELLVRCPNVKKLVIHHYARCDELKMLADYSSSMVRVVRKYMHVDVQFVREKQLMQNIKI